MSDTRPVICWALERPCALREGTDCRDPDQTRQKLYQIQACAEKALEGGLVDGIWVTSSFWGNDAADCHIDIPHSGIRVAKVAEPFGGWDVVHRTCRDCEANIRSAGEGVAGCHHSLEVMYPGCEKLDALLWDTVRLRGLEERLRSCFHVTTPLWYGFWIESPLRRPQCELLLEILPSVLPRLWGKEENGDDCEPIFDTQFAFSDFNPAEHYGQEFDAFFRALRAAIDWELPLHVRMSTPGHVDLGWYTQFPHCPRCKVEADLPRWQESVDSCEYRCQVCGHVYDPAETHRSERDDYDLESHSLEKQLGAEYDAFAIRFAASQGWSERQMREALDIHRDGPVRRQIAKVRKRNRRLEHKYPASVAVDHPHALPATLLLELAPGVMLELIRIPPGEFLMGADSDGQTSPRRLVRIDKPFYLGKFPVTQMQWQAVTGSNPSRCREDGLLPVEQVTWFDAQDFCVRLSELVGRRMRLPSEAEWEYACRAGTTTRYWFGDEVGPLQANCDTTARSPEDFLTITERSQATTTPVDRYPPNPWGLYDLHGNVEEWCEDTWHENYEGAPTDGSAWIDDGEQTVNCVARGGAAYVIGSACGSADRRCQRACAGARPFTPPEEGQDEFLRSVLRSLCFTEFYGLRVACSVVPADAAD